MRFTLAAPLFALAASLAPAQGLFGLGGSSAESPGQGGSAPVAALAPQGPLVQVEYRLEVSEPGATRVPVTCRFRGLTPGAARLGLVAHAAPGIRPTREAYGLEAAPSVRLIGKEGAREARATWSSGGDEFGMRGMDIVTFEPAPSAGDVVELRYELDLSDASAVGGPDKRPEGKDRVALGDEYAVIRGDVLLLALDGVTTSIGLDLQLPEGWGRVGGPGPAVSQMGPGFSGLVGIDWVALAYAEGVAAATRESLAGIDLQAAVVGRGRDQVLPMIRARLKDYTGRFGTEDLAYLPRGETGRPTVTVVAFSGSGEGAVDQGGQYLASAGTAVFQYRIDGRVGLGHTISHELFHAWNDAGLRNQGLDPWWVEGFTDLVAMRQNAALEGEAANRDFRQRNLGRLFQGTEEVGGPGGPVLASWDPRAQAGSFTDAGENERLAYDIPVALLLGVDQILGAGGMDRWYRTVQERHGVGAAQGTGARHAQVKQAAMDVAGSRSGELEEFFARYFERPVTLRRQDVAGWMQPARP